MSVTSSPPFPYLQVQVHHQEPPHISQIWWEIFPDLPTSEITFSSHTLTPGSSLHWSPATGSLASESFVNNLFLPSNFDLLTIAWAFLIQNASLAKCHRENTQLIAELNWQWHNLQATFNFLQQLKYISCRKIILWKQIGMPIIKSQTHLGPPLPKLPSPSVWKCKRVPVWINLPDKLKEGVGLRTIYFAGIGFLSILLWNQELFVWSLPVTQKPNPYFVSLCNKAKIINNTQRDRMSYLWKELTKLQDLSLEMGILFKKHRSFWEFQLNHGEFVIVPIFLSFLGYH